MNRARLPETGLAALATVVVLWPLTTLFTPNSWVVPTLLMVAAVTLAGAGLRALTPRTFPVVAGQLAVFTFVASWMHGRGHLWFGVLPSPDMVLAFNNLLFDARMTIANYAAPAPSNRGIILAIGLIAGLFAILVDVLAVTRRSPAVAGLPLLAAFLISASNSGNSLNPVYFVAAGAIWLVLVGRQGTASVRRWSTVATLGRSARGSDSADGSLSFAGTGRVLGAAGLVAAVALPVVIPHLPTRYLVDGLGRSVDSTGFSDGQVGLNSTLDLAKNLESPSNDPVLEFSTTAANPDPLRVGVLTTYRNETWRPAPTQPPMSTQPQIDRSSISPSVPSQTETITVRNSRLEAPQIAAPYPVVSGDLDGRAWGVDPDTLVARVEQSVDNYQMDFLALSPERSALEQPVNDPDASFQFQRALEVDPESRDAVAAALAEAAPDAGNRLETATAIQQYLRSTDFSYSLELAPTQRGDDGRRLDPISNFLATRTGYCVQYATAMVMMAREAGIPARMAIGFLPGSGSSGAYTVRASDAHAWPELYFEDVGWLRFEPTPASRVSRPPDYTLAETPDGTSTATAGPTDGPSTSVTRDPGANDPGAVADPTDTGGSDAAGGWLSLDRARVLGWSLLALAGLVLALAAVPLAARWRRRRALADAADDPGRVEALWASLLESVRDLGVVPPSGATPRQAGRHLVREAYLEGAEVEALQRVVLTLERGRYAPPGRPLEDITSDIDAVRRQVGRTRRRSDRLRARWWPGEGLTQWQEWGSALRALVTGPWDAARTRFARS